MGQPIAGQTRGASDRVQIIICRAEIAEIVLDPDDRLWYNCNYDQGFNERLKCEGMQQVWYG